MSDSNEKHGMTGPVTLRESPPAFEGYSKALAAYLESSGFYESEESAQTRERVLGKLDFLVKKFVSDCAPDGANGKYGGKIFTFGSYRLGVHDRGADIDALCVVPRHVHRTDFFTLFYEQLKADPNISELSKVEDAYVPLIKLCFHGIPIDMTFARLNVSVIKENINLLNDTILRTMDEKCIMSLNGSRATDVMLRLVPDTAVFYGALRAIKFWAQRRYVYGAAYGFFGGIAFSISVARVCQMYPNLCSFEVVCKFFETYSTWKWPAPVMLREVTDMNYNLKVWDPKTYPADRYHKMPVITPVYPQKCATHNVTQSTASFITAEFTRAHEILSGVSALHSSTIEKASVPPLDAILSKLFEFSDFFKKHRLFIEIVTTAPEEHHLLWKGFVESKVRLLAMKLEAIENVSAAIPFPKAFKIRIKDQAGFEDYNNAGRSKIKECQNGISTSQKSVDTEICANSQKSVENDNIKRTRLNQDEETTPDQSSCVLDHLNTPSSQVSIGSSQTNCIQTNQANCTQSQMTSIFKEINNSNKINTYDQINIPEKVELHAEDCKFPKDGLAINTGETKSNKEATINTAETKSNKESISNNKFSSIHTNGTTNELLSGLSVSSGRIETHFFIALDVLPSKKNDKKLYVDSQIKEYLSFLNGWEKKTESMTVRVNAKKKKDVQAFLREYYAEESE